MLFILVKWQNLKLWKHIRMQLRD